MPRTIERVHLHLFFTEDLAPEDPAAELAKSSTSDRVLLTPRSGRLRVTPVPIWDRRWWSRRFQRRVRPVSDLLYDD